MTISFRRWKIAAAIYTLILAVIICLADVKGTQYLLNFVGNIPYGDKIGHLVLMGTFSLLLNLALGCRKIGKIPLGSLIVLTIVTIEEFSQIFVRGRTFDWGDLLFDFIGIFVFGELAKFIGGKIQTISDVR